MADVLMFHHALGVTAGLASFADELRKAGHTVTLPDLFDGQTFTAIDAGVAYAQSIGFDTILDRGVAAASALDVESYVVVGFSLGVMPAQKLAQTDDRVCAASLCYAALPVGVFAETWPQSVALQIHIVANDPWAEEDLPAARELAEVSGGDLFTYAGTGHLVADPTSGDYDADAAGQILGRTLELLAAPHP